MGAPRRRAAPRRSTPGLRTGRDYLASLRDGRNVWVLGVGPVDDVTTHPATAAVAAEYATWYDRHRDPAWRDVLCDDAGKALAFAPPRTTADLRRLGRAIHAVALVSGGNLTHTPGYGALIALGVETGAHAAAPERVAAAAAYRADLAATSRFLTFSSGGGPPADRFRPDAEAAGARVVERSKTGIVVDGMLGVHTAVPFSHEVLVLARHPAGPAGWAWFVVPVAAAGVRIVTRPPAARPADRFAAPLSARFDELDAVMWLDRVEIPNTHVFALGEAAGDQRHRDQVVAWLLWHQLIGWMARADFTLGLGLALAEVLSRRDDPAIADAVTDLVTDAQTLHTCLTAAELDPEVAAGGHALPRRLHLAPGALHALAARRRMDETLRRIAGAPALVAPTASDLADKRIARDLERALGGGGYTARQRAALLNLVWDHLASSLAGREASYEMFGSGGDVAWRMRLRRWFDRYGRLVAAAHDALEVPMQRKDRGGARTRR